MGNQTYLTNYLLGPTISEFLLFLYHQGMECLSERFGVLPGARRIIFTAIGLAKTYEIHRNQI